MKNLVLLSVITITLGCGKSGSTPASSVIPTPGVTPHQTVYTMVASRSEPGDANSPAVQSFTQTGSVVIPSTGQPNSDATDAINSTFMIGSVTCSYNKPANANVYVFHDCTGGYKPGDTVTFPNNSSIEFFIQSGYCTQNCQAQISVTVTQ